MQRDEADRMTESQREAYEERAAILEYDAGLPRKEAERRAREMVLGRRSEIARIKAMLEES